MKNLLIFFRFYVHSNIHVSIASACLVLLTGEFYKINVGLLALFIGLSTFISYNFIRFLKAKTETLKVEILDWFQKTYTLLFIFVVLAISALLFVTFKIGLEKLWLVFPFGIITFLYMLPLLKIGKNKMSLRNIPGVKIFSIAFSWAGLGSLLPLYYAAYAIDTIEIFYFFQILLFVFVLTLPFDIRDIAFDQSSLRTIPQVIGLFKTKIVGSFCLLLSLCLHLYVFAFDFFFSSLLIYVCLTLLLFYSKTKQSKYYASFLVESIPILWYVLIYFS
ncbi:UbiA prenyltransferase family protein [Flavicella sediminum]|uniref:hypothetical protein n=1 Tax=Flavicella sediminum TaxID=2585141 RepID=UPI00111F8B50|nr:hypothetical protein [Flavicella sediminum]